MLPALLYFISISLFGYVMLAAAQLPNDFNRTEVDVVLRPSIRAATETTDIFKIWGGEIVIPKQRVKIPAPAQSPGSASPPG